MNQFCTALLYGDAVRLTAKKWRFPAPRSAACLAHYSLVQKVTSPRFTILKFPAPTGSDLYRARLRRRHGLPLGPRRLHAEENMGAGARRRTHHLILGVLAGPRDPPCTVILKDLTP